MIKFEYWEGNEPEFINENNTDKLWKQGVSLDDFDYMLFFENDQITITNTSRFRFELTPDDYQIEGLLHGCCKNKWYHVEDFMGRKGILGVAYHA